MEELDNSEGVAVQPADSEETIDWESKAQELTAKAAELEERYKTLQRSVSKKDRQVRELEDSQWAIAQGLANWNRATETVERLTETLTALPYLEAGDREKLRKVLDNQRDAGTRDSEALRTARELRDFLRNNDVELEDERLGEVKRLADTGKFTEAKAAAEHALTSSSPPLDIDALVEAKVVERLKTQLGAMKESTGGTPKRERTIDAVMADMRKPENRRDPTKSAALLAELKHLGV